MVKLDVPMDYAVNFLSKNTTMSLPEYTQVVTEILLEGDKTEGQLLIAELKKGNAERVAVLFKCGAQICIEDTLGKRRLYTDHVSRSVFNDCVTVSAECTELLLDHVLSLEKGSQAYAMVSSAVQTQSDRLTIFRRILDMNRRIQLYLHLRCLPIQTPDVPTVITLAKGGLYYPGTKDLLDHIIKEDTHEQNIREQLLSMEKALAEFKALNDENTSLKKLFTDATLSAPPTSDLNRMACEFGVFKGETLSLEQCKHIMDGLQKT